MKKPDFKRMTWIRPRYLRWQFSDCLAYQYKSLTFTSVIGKKSLQEESFPNILRSIMQGNIVIFFSDELDSMFEPLNIWFYTVKVKAPSIPMEFDLQ